MNENIQIGQSIQKKIKESGIKAKWLAKQIDCSESKMSRICKQRQLIDTDTLIQISIHLEYNFCDDYAKYVDKQMQKKSSFSLSHIYKFITNEGMHIGKLIQKVKEVKDIKICWMSEMLPYSEGNIYKIFKREKVDMDLLVSFCVCLEFNFFDICAEYVNEQIQKKNSDNQYIT